MVEKECESKCELLFGKADGLFKKGSFWLAYLAFFDIKREYEAQDQDPQITHRATVGMLRASLYSYKETGDRYCLDCLGGQVRSVCWNSSFSENEKFFWSGVYNLFMEDYAVAEQKLRLAYESDADGRNLEYAYYYARVLVKRKKEREAFGVVSQAVRIAFHSRRVGETVSLEMLSELLQQRGEMLYEQGNYIGGMGSFFHGLFIALKLRFLGQTWPFRQYCLAMFSPW